MIEKRYIFINAYIAYLPTLKTSETYEIEELYTLHSVNKTFSSNYFFCRRKSYLSMKYCANI